MAFCNSCGANLAPGTRFCNKCGAAVVASSPAPGAPAGVSTGPAPTPAAAATSGGSALKIILIVFAVIVVLGVLGMATAGFFAWRVAKSVHTHIREDGNNVKVETPFGNVGSNQDPQEAARSLGVDPYPGAQVLKDGAATATFGGIRTASANFESSDSVDKVASFYKSRYPNALVTTTEQDRCTIISNDKKSMITINIEADGGRTKIQITNVSHNADASSSSSN